MSLFSELRERRLVQIVFAYAATGWVLLEVIGSLVERGMVPEMVYGIAFVLYLGGLCGSIVVGWFHGEKGHQEWTALELSILAVIGIGTLTLTVQRVRGELATRALVEARASGAPLSRVAVLYFTDLSPDGDDTWLADALTEDLIRQLGRVDGIDVMSTDAVLPWRGGDPEPREVGTSLDVGSVIEGSVEDVRGELRVNVRLLDGASGFEMDRTTLERPREEIIAATRDVVDEVAGLLREQLGEEVRLRSVAGGTESTDAWRALQQAERDRKDLRLLPVGAGEEGMQLTERADSLLSAAAALDPEWSEPALLRAQLALDFAQTTGDRDAQAEWLSRGLERIDDYLADRPDDPRGLETRGNLRLFAHLAYLAADAREHEEYLEGAQADLQRAIREDRSLAGAHASLSVLYYQPGVADLTSAALHASSAYEADPFLRFADDILDRLFWTRLDLGQFSSARESCELGAARFPRDPRFTVCSLWLMTIPRATPAIAEGWATQADFVALVGEELQEFEELRGRMLMAAAIARLAENGSERDRAMLADSARSVLQTAHDDYEALDDPYRELYSLEAFAWVVLDEFDLAIDRWKVYASLNHGFQDSGDISWRWQELRAHPRFDEVVTQEAAH